MSSSLRQLEFLEVYPSEANFLLVRLKPALREEEGMAAREMKDRLAERGIFVRYFNTPRLRDCLRISVGLPEHTDRLVAALKEQGGSGA